MSRKNQNICALIPARSGSKRLKNKNVMDLGGKPLISWTIGAALESGVCDRVIVSTDCPVIREIAEQEGAEVPFLRPKELASDEATTFSVFEHAHSICGFQPITLLLQPTSPFRDAQHIRNAVKLKYEHEVPGVISVCELDHPVEWSNTLSHSGSMDKFIDHRHLNKRSQEFDTRFRLNGAIYLADTDRLIKEKTFMVSGAIAYRMPIIDSVDIDSRLDFLLAKTIIEATESD